MHNPDLALAVQNFLGDAAPASMEKVFPVRFYGDGAEAFGLNSFEMLTMISVAPKHSSSLKTRFVFLENNGCAKFESVYITSNVSCGTLSFIYSHVSSEVYLHIFLN